LNLFVCGARMYGMTAKERVLEHLPGWSEEQARRALQAAEEKPERSGAADEAPIPTLEESFEILGSIDFPPREDAWR
jgi:hypothetical protein